jgi:hypothetical protein
MRQRLLIPGWLAMVLSLGGCTITVSPPREPVSPATVYLIDQQYSASLVMPDESRWVRYIYAEWSYYALGNQDATGALRAVLVPSQATLARRKIRSVGSMKALAAALDIEAEAIYALPVERSRVSKLVGRLNEAYRKHQDQAIYDPLQKLGFVPYPSEPYHLLHNSNTVVAQWLEELGCSVRGVAILSRWQIREPVKTFKPEAKHGRVD